MKYVTSTYSGFYCSVYGIATDSMKHPFTPISVVFALFFHAKKQKDRYLGTINTRSSKLLIFHMYVSITYQKFGRSIDKKLHSLFMTLYYITCNALITPPPRIYALADQSFLNVNCLSCINTIVVKGITFVISVSDIYVHYIKLKKFINKLHHVIH